MNDTIETPVSPVSVGELLAERILNFRSREKFRIVGTRTEVIAGQSVEVKLVESAYDKFRHVIEIESSRVHARIPYNGERGGTVWVNPQR